MQIFVLILDALVAITLFILQRLQTKVIKIVDVSYGGENGFNQAIELASEALGNVKFIQEKKLIGMPVLDCAYLLEKLFFSCFNLCSTSKCTLCPRKNGTPKHALKFSKIASFAQFQFNSMNICLFSIKVPILLKICLPSLKY